MEERLSELAEEGASFLQSVNEPILCFSHYDCDGISSAVIVNQMLERAGKEFTQIFLDELTEEKLRDGLAGDDHPVILFTDIGSGQLETIETVAGDRTVAVFDHHEIETEKDIGCHVNPHLVGIDGGEQISGAGVTYLVAQAVDDDNVDLVQYALVGATGDIQTSDDGEYLGMNQGFLDEAREEGYIRSKKGLKLYGRQGRSLVKALTYTTDPYLDGITDNESGAVQFLRSTGIDLRDENGDWRSLADLSQEEEQQIVHELITRGYGDIERLLGDIHILENGWEINEFSSLMNACGRMDRAEDGLQICLDQDDALARRVKKAYGRKISEYISFVEDNSDNREVVQEMEHGTLITADDAIDANMIGTVSTICIKSDILPGPLVVGMAEKEEDFIKISARASDSLIDDGLELSELLETSCERCGGEGGGHRKAAGGKIPKEEQERFIKVMSEIVTESING
jgi:RecJ-like exonuclease